MTLSAVSWPALGTTAHVVVTRAAALDAARAAVESELEEIDRACSRFRADAEIRRVCAAGGEATAISALLAEAVGVALDAARRTGGLVDPTIGAGLVAAGYDRDFAQLPRDAPAEPPVAAAGWRTVDLDRRGRTLQLAPGTILDLGAIAKALAADRAATAAVAATACGVLVGLGGDIAIGGEAPAGGWPVGIADAHDSAVVETTVTVRCGALATSSTTQRRWRRGGQEMHHILDPHTGLPVISVWRTASVAAGSCVAANTASTAAILMGEHAPYWLAREGLPARLVRTDGTVVGTCGWAPDGLVV
jgi:thiamine biosynthesis lipoprotein